MNDLVTVRRALLSVSDKTGLAGFAAALANEFGVTLLSTGGTAKALRDAGLTVTDVGDVTGFPEMMDGRLKTLHPKVHGGLLAVRDDPEHVAAMATHGIEPIDLVCVNLYPFEQTVARPGVTVEEAIENIDIGGPAMVRSAAKNHAGVAVVTDPGQYDKVLGDLRKHDGSTCRKHRLELARKAFARTYEYDRAIASYLDGVVERTGEIPGHLSRPRTQKPQPKIVPLRYGENPHQAAFLIGYPGGTTASVATATQHHGKALSYINVLDADAALACVKEFAGPAACVVKHATPCGVAAGKSVAEALENAYAADPVAAFGGIVATNVPIDAGAAGVLTVGQKFLEVIVAPSFTPDALDVLKSRWKNVRLLEVGPVAADDAGQKTADTSGSFARLIDGPTSVRTIVGGELHQAADTVGIVESEWKPAGRRPPTESEMLDLRVAWLACKHVKSNAIVIAKHGATVGIGGGQVDRVGACRIAAEKAGDRAKKRRRRQRRLLPLRRRPEAAGRRGRDRHRPARRQRP